MPFVVRIHRPRGNAPWSEPNDPSTRYRMLEQAQARLETEVMDSATMGILGRLRALVLKLRARNAQPGEHIEAGDYDHWIEAEEEPDPGTPET